jgi:hypothetical protein
VTGMQFVTLGLLGEMLARTYHESQGKPVYVLAEDLPARQDAGAGEPGPLLRSDVRPAGGSGVIAGRRSG